MFIITKRLATCRLIFHHALAFAFVLIFIVPLKAYSQQRSATLDQQGFVQMRPLVAEGQEQRLTMMSLNQAIEQGLRKNFDQSIRELTQNVLEINQQDLMEDFWYPKLSISLSSAPQRLGTLYRGGQDGYVASESHSGHLRIGFDDYTLFNWGKDYLNYLARHQEIERNQARLNEEHRELKHQVILVYSNLLAAHAIEQTRRLQLRHASYIYNLNRERVQAQNATRQDYYQARSEHLRAQDEFFKARLNHERAHEMLAELINDPAHTRYALDESLRFTPLNLTLQEAKEIAKLNNPQVLQSQSDLAVSSYDLQRYRRENLPLPRLSLTLGSYHHGIGSNSSNSFRYSSGAGSSNVELVASLNATWTLLGSGGALNSRNLKKAHYQQRIAQKKLRQSHHQVESVLQDLYYQIENFQQRIQILNAENITLKRNFDTVLSNYTRGQASFQDFHHALQSKMHSLEEHTVVKFEHLRAKLELASLIGVEDFPGQRFEENVARK